MKKKLLVILFLLYFILSALTAEAIGIGVKPKELIFENGQAKMLVTNITDEPAIYSINLDQFQDTIQIEPIDFRLETGASRLISLRVKNTHIASINTNLLIVGRSLGITKLPLAAGVKIPVIVKTSGVSLSQILIIGLILIIVGLLNMGIVRLKKN